jgi:hypothetical protein
MQLAEEHSLKGSQSQKEMQDCNLRLNKCPSLQSKKVQAQEEAVAQDNRGHNNHHNNHNHNLPKTKSGTGLWERGQQRLV